MNTDNRNNFPEIDDNEHRGYNPVHRAYEILVPYFDGEDVDIEAAIGYLGEALAD